MRRKVAEDYYETLGVGRNASEQDIQKAYRDLARQYHPDLNPDDQTAKEKFQKVQNAFDVLNSPDKRKQYDQFGHGFESMGAGGPGGAHSYSWPSPGGPGGGSGPQAGGINFEDLFGGGGGGGFADMFRQFRGGEGVGAGVEPPPTGGADLEHTLTVPFTTAVSGGEAHISVRRQNGKVEEIRVKIPPGIDDGKKIRLRGQGEQGPLGGKPGDILITVTASPHPFFQRRGRNLDVTVPITLGEAANGAKVDVPTPTGTITLSIPPGTSSGTKLRIKGHGVKPADGEPGDLFADIQVVLPKKLSKEERKQLAEMAKGYSQDPRHDLRW